MSTSLRIKIELVGTTATRTPRWKAMEIKALPSFSLFHRRGIWLANFGRISPAYLEERGQDKMQYRILLVDDDQASIYATQSLLEDQGYEVDAVTTAQEAIARIEEKKIEYAVVLLDYRMPGKNGALIAQEMLASNPEQFILIYSGDDSKDALRSTFKAGVVDFIEKGSGHVAFLNIVRDCCRKYDETRRTLQVPRHANPNQEIISSIGMIGVSDGMTEVARRILRFRESEENVLISGETGTGKELVARALVQNRGSQVRVINCASYRSNTHLLESELFGYEKGAFTGAATARTGILETAKGGTVFFDELHQLGIDAQAKLLRALQEKKIRRVGGQVEYPVDFRIIAAVKPGLEDLVAKGEFLPDFFYRLNVLCIDIPPLRERLEDIEPLVNHFCSKWEIKYQKRRSFRIKTIRQMEKYSWPGNIRELENVVSRLLTGANGSAVEPIELDPKFFHSENVVKNETLPQLKIRQEREELEFIRLCLGATRSKAEVAKRMGISPNTLHSKMIKFGLYQEGLEV